MAVATPVTGRHSIVTPSTAVRTGRAVLDGLRRTGRADERPAHEVDVRPLRFGRTPVTNLEYAWFLAAGRVARAALVEGPALLGSRPAGGRRHLVRSHGLLLLAVGDAGRPLAAADRGRVGARRPGRARRGAHLVGRRDPARRDPRGAPIGTLARRARHRQRLRPARHRHRGPRVVPRLVRARRLPAHAPLRPARTRAGRDAREPRRLLAAPRARRPARRRVRVARRTRAPPTAASAWCARCRERPSRRRPRGRAPAGAAARAGRARRARARGRIAPREHRAGRLDARGARAARAGLAAPPAPARRRRAHRSRRARARLRPARDPSARAPGAWASSSRRMGSAARERLERALGIGPRTRGRA